MVKENDTWQFTNWPFLISKSPTRTRPTHGDSDWQSVCVGSVRNRSSYILFMSLLSPWEFPPPQINLLWEKKKRKKMYHRHLSLSFHQISWRRSVGGRACAGGEVIKLWVWSNVRHSQTTLMPCVVICQNELWSRILLITLLGEREVTAVSRLCLFLSALVCRSPCATT